MGWAGGNQVAEDLYERIKDLVPPESRNLVASIILETFEGEDADDWNTDSALIQDAQPDWLEEEE